jgi:CspA family cold shock protein
VHTGKINKLIRDRGFGFIDDTDGRRVFFHKSSLEGVTFEALKEDEKVEFEVEDSPKGPRAVNIHIPAAS